MLSLCAFASVNAALIRLRLTRPEAERPFRVPVYPWAPIVFCLSCGYMLYASATYAGFLALLGAAPLLLGLPLFAVSRRMDARQLQDLS